jgi:hypothetical protein
MRAIVFIGLCLNASIAFGQPGGEESAGERKIFPFVNRSGGTPAADGLSVLAAGGGVADYNFDEGSVKSCLGRGDCTARITVESIVRDAKTGYRCEGRVPAAIIVGNGKRPFYRKVIRWEVTDSVRNVKVTFGTGSAPYAIQPIYPAGVTPDQLTDPKPTATTFSWTRNKGGQDQDVGGGTKYPITVLRYEIRLEFKLPVIGQVTCVVDPLIVNVGS